MTEHSEVTSHHNCILVYHVNQKSLSLHLKHRFVCKILLLYRFLGKETSLSFNIVCSFVIYCCFITAYYSEIGNVFIRVRVSVYTIT